VGRYRVLRVIASGGMGTVYEAIQDQPRRQVALKVLKTGLASADALRRFEHEAAFLARLRHPGIAQIYEACASETGGSAPFFAMEFIPDARTITEYAHRGRHTVREKLELIARVCDAIHHGHQRGVIHRDLKPGNILVDGSGQPKVIDFGVARTTEADVTLATLDTLPGHLVGTLRYMSPEQCRGDAAEIDIRCDVYALGVVLFELLTGELPYELTTHSPFEMPRLIREVEPRRPSTLDRSLRGDVETILLKALEKECEHRYDSAFALGQDIRRYLRGEPIEARRGHRWYVLKKNLYRHRVAAAVAALFVLLVAASAVTLGLLFHRANVHAEALRVSEYFNTIALAQNAYETGGTSRLKALLRRCPQDLRGWEWNYLDRLSDMSLATWSGHPGGTTSLAVSPDGRWVVSGGWVQDPTIKLWDVATGAVIKTFEGHRNIVSCVAFLAGGDRILSASYDTTVKVWDSRTGGLIHTLEGTEEVYRVACTPDGRRIVSGEGEDLVKIWDGETGLLLQTLYHRTTDGKKDPAEKDEQDAISALAVSGDGKWIASGNCDTTIMVWDAESGQPRLTIPAHSKRVACLAFTPDGERLYSASWDKTLKIWDTATGKHIRTFGRGDSVIYDLALSADGRRLAVARGTIIQYLRPESAESPITLLGHGDIVLRLSFFPEASRLVSCSRDGTLKIWNPGRGGRSSVLGRHAYKVDGLACSRDGRWLAALGRPNVVKLYDLDTGSEVGVIRQEGQWTTSIAISPNGRHLASGSLDHRARVWALPAGTLEIDLGDHEGALVAVAWSPDGRCIASGGVGRTVKVWAAGSGDPGATIVADEEEVMALAFAPDGKRLASAGIERVARIWDATTGALLVELADPTDAVPVLAWSPDGTHIVTNGPDRTLVIRSVDTGRTVRILRGHDHVVLAVAYSPDGRRIVSGARDNTVRIWDAETGQLGITLRGHAYEVSGVTFTPDGHRVLSTSHDKSIRVWDAGPRE